MLNQNESYLRETKKTTEFFTFNILYPVLFLFYLVTSSLVIIISTIGISVIFYFPFFFKKLSVRSFLNFSVVIYLTLSLIVSVSPKLQFLSFKFSNPDMFECQGEIIDYKTHWESTTKVSNASAYVNTIYTTNNLNIKTNSRKTLAFYSTNLWNSKHDISKKKKELETEMNNHIKERNFKILINKKGDSKLFMTTKVFLFKGSFGFQFLVMIFKFLIIIVSIIFLYPLIKKVINVK